MHSKRRNFKGRHKLKISGQPQLKQFSYGQWGSSLHPGVSRRGREKKIFIDCGGKREVFE